jgi:hypothetical protein
MNRNASSRQALSKPDQHPTYLACPADEFPFRGARNEPEIRTQLDVRSEFVGGAKGDIEESGHVTMATPATAFGDVGRNRDCGSPCLIDQHEPLRNRIVVGRLVHQQRKGLALLPDRQLHEVIHETAIRPAKAHVKRAAATVTASGPARATAYCLLIAANQ